MLPQPNPNLFTQPEYGNARLRFHFLEGSCFQVPIQKPMGFCEVGDFGRTRAIIHGYLQNKSFERETAEANDQIFIRRQASLTLVTSGSKGLPASSYCYISPNIPNIDIGEPDLKDCLKSLRSSNLTRPALIIRVMKKHRWVQLLHCAFLLKPYGDAGCLASILDAGKLS
jgi:hypothetical protein